MTYTKESIKRGRDAKKGEGCKNGEEWEFLGKRIIKTFILLKNITKLLLE